MKKISFFIFLAGVLLLSANLESNAQNTFSGAVATCEEYFQEGVIEYNKEPFSISVSLKPLKNGACEYKEKIFQGKKYQMLTCEFEKAQLGFISDSMQRFNDTFKTEIAKNKIFEAKMTSNGEVFQK